MAAQLKEWSAQIDLLEAKAANAGADIRVKRADKTGASANSRLLAQTAVTLDANALTQPAP